jgi:hypothetical protein
MSNPSFTTTILVDQTLEQAFGAVNNARGWWSEEIEGQTDKVGATFKYHFRDLHRCEIQVKELIPGEKVVWHILDNYFSYATSARLVRSVRFNASPSVGLQCMQRHAHLRVYFRSRLLLISSLNFRMSSNVLRGFSDTPAEVAVL